MEQVYFVRSGADGLECVYQYGNYTYFGPVAMKVPAGVDELKSTLAQIQKEQGAIPFFAETAKIGPGTLAGQCLASLSSALAFIGEELTSVIEEIAGLAETETWLDAEDSALYFEFETRTSYPMMVRQAALASKLWLKQNVTTVANEPPADARRIKDPSACCDSLSLMGARGPVGFLCIATGCVGIAWPFSTRSRPRLVCSACRMPRSCMPSRTKET
jgi:hypothetical protein